MSTAASASINGLIFVDIIEVAEADAVIVVGDVVETVLESIVGRGRKIED